MHKPMPPAMNILDTKVAVDKEWEKLGCRAGTETMQKCSFCNAHGVVPSQKVRVGQEVSKIQRMRCLMWRRSEK